MLKSKIDLLVLSEDRNRDISRSFEELVKMSKISAPNHYFQKFFVMHVTERMSDFALENCFALNCTLKLCSVSQEKKRTLRVKNCLYFDVEWFHKLMIKLFEDMEG